MQKLNLVHEISEVRTVRYFLKRTLGTSTIFLLHPNIALNASPKSIHI